MLLLLLKQGLNAFHSRKSLSNRVLLPGFHQEILKEFINECVLLLGSELEQY